jgi:peroxiredoxin
MALGQLRRKVVFRVVGAVGAALVLGSMLVLPGVARAESAMGQDKFKVGDTAPEFATQDTAGKNVKLSDYAGKKVVLLNFWGIRCGACLEEMPYLEEIHKKYAGKGLVTLGVDTDGVDAQMIADTLKEVGVSVSYQLLLDLEFKITDQYTNFLVPLTLVIDRGGIVRYIHTGFEKGREADYEDAVKKALGS